MPEKGRDVESRWSVTKWYECLCLSGSATCGVTGERKEKLNVEDKVRNIKNFKKKKKLL